MNKMKLDGHLVVVVVVLAVTGVKISECCQAHFDNRLVYNC